MLKILPLANLSQQAKAKCGEIFCHSSTDFTIYCSFCDMKAFSLEDFVLHIQNVHFENNILKMETNNANCQRQQYLNVKMENNGNFVAGREQLWNNLEEIQHNEADDLDDDDYDEEDYEYEEEIETVLKKTKKPNRNNNESLLKPMSYLDSGEEEEDNEHTSDEDFKPKLSKRGDSTKRRLSEETSFKCNECSKTFKNQGLLKIHFKHKHEEKSTTQCSKTNEKEDLEQLCPECKQVFANKKYLDKHVLAEHNGYKCAQCDRRFKQRHQCKSHEQTHNTERSLICPFENCGRRYIEQSYLQLHIETHSTDGNFICDIDSCGKSFQNRRRLTVHKRIHTKPKEFICDTCGYCCRIKETLRVHQRIHTGERPFACEVCDKRFTSKSALAEHMAMHSNTRPHVCKVCNASFARQKALYHHSFLHSDVKKFRCKICGNAYKQASGLAGHMRKHREEGMMSMLPEQPTVVAAPPSNTFLSF